MVKQIQTVLMVIIAITIITLVLNGLWSNKNLVHALKKIDTLQINLNKALVELNYSKLQIDTMKKELINYKTFIYEIKGRTEILDLEKRKNEVRFISDKMVIQKRLDSLYRVIGIQIFTISIEPL
jgi:hypothetical protein